MKLKNVIKKYDNKELESIIVSLYKCILKKVKEEYDIDSYYKNEKIKGCTLCITDLYFINKDIKYFKDNYYERFNEVKEYESNIDKIDYRDSLVKEYDELKGIVISLVLFYKLELVFHQKQFFFYTLNFLRCLVMTYILI